jgi:hypothetical protein
MIPLTALRVSPRAQHLSIEEFARAVKTFAHSSTRCGAQRGEGTDTRAVSVALIVLAVAALWLASVSFPAALAGPAELPGAHPLFNGNDLAGWQVPTPNPFWKGAAGVLVGENDEKLAGSMLYTEKSYKDFVLETDVRWSGEIDSGIMFRRPEIQLQFGVSRSLKTDMTCSFYTGGQEKYPLAGRAQGLEKLFKPNEWNRVRLEAKGDVFTVWLNGNKPAATPIQNTKTPGQLICKSIRA